MRNKVKWMTKRVSLRRLFKSMSKVVAFLIEIFFKIPKYSFGIEKIICLYFEFIWQEIDQQKSIAKDLFLGQLRLCHFAVLAQNWSLPMSQFSINSLSISLIHWFGWGLTMIRPFNSQLVVRRRWFTLSTHITPSPNHLQITLSSI